MRTYNRTYRSTRNGKSFLPYTNYGTENLLKAVTAVRNNTLTLGEAARRYGVPKSTLSRKYRNINCTQQKAGHPTLFSNEEEDIFLKYLTLLAEWGFPLDLTDLRVFAQKYLNKVGKTVYSLQDNMPGVDWARNFMSRHKAILSNRLASNISTDRAKITEEVIDTFFENWTQSVEGVEPDCVINYDETNLTDDPGNKKYIYKRGVKYPERVINSSKSAISLMFTGTASGDSLPVYVVYKAEGLWDTWLEGGPEGTRYNRSKSGWFDTTCFEDWFNTIIVPYARKKDGKKVVVVGDNLSSHFSENVLKTCEEMNISFVCLPPKSTHLLQPLDVAFYAPLKNYWKTILTEWKKLEGRKHKTLVKSSFPHLLLKLQNKLLENGVGKANLIAGFNKCGLLPIDPLRPKSRLPSTSNVLPIEEATSATTEVIADILKEMRGVASSSTTRRKKRCQVAPGKSITAQDIAFTTAPKASTSNVTRDDEYDSDRTEVLSDHIIDNPASPLPSGSSHSKRKAEGNEKYLKAKRQKTANTTKKGKAIGKKCKPNTVETEKKTTKKGKGIGKKTKPSIADKVNKLKKKNKQTSEDDTSVSDYMSLHSDSDIAEDFDIERDIFGTNGLNFDDIGVCEDIELVTTTSSTAEYATLETVNPIPEKVSTRPDTTTSATTERITQKSASSIPKKINIGPETTSSTLEDTSPETTNSIPNPENVNFDDFGVCEDIEIETTISPTAEYATLETVNPIPVKVSTRPDTTTSATTERITQKSASSILKKNNIGPETTSFTLEDTSPETTNSIPNPENVNTGPETTKLLTAEHVTPETINSISVKVNTGPETTKLSTAKHIIPQTIHSIPVKVNTEPETTKSSTAEHITPETINSIPIKVNTGSETSKLSTVEHITPDTIKSNPVEVNTGPETTKLSTAEHITPETAKSINDNVNTGPEITKLLTIESTTPGTANPMPREVNTGPIAIKFPTVKNNLCLTANSVPEKLVSCSKSMTEYTPNKQCTIKIDKEKLSLEKLNFVAGETSTRVETVDHKNAECTEVSTEDDNFIEENYNVNDHVIVRYYIRKKWVHFIGVIEEVKKNRELFAIRFYKTIKKPLRFTQPRKPDRDEVPFVSIVKKVDLFKNVGNTKELFLLIDQDCVYFS